MMMSARLGRGTGDEQLVVELSQIVERRVGRGGEKRVGVSARVSFVRAHRLARGRLRLARRRLGLRRVRERRRTIEHALAMTMTAALTFAVTRVFRFAASKFNSKIFFF